MSRALGSQPTPISFGLKQLLGRLMEPEIEVLLASGAGLSRMGVEEVSLGLRAVFAPTATVGRVMSSTAVGGSWFTNTPLSAVLVR